MDFQVGEAVVYPSHGVALVEAILEASIGGQSWSCYRLRLLASNAVVVVPRGNTEAVGLRRTVRPREARVVLDGLRREPTGASSDWKGRYKENTDRMRSGRLAEVAEVLRNLSRLRSSRSLSYREKTMLDKARELVVGEIAAVEKQPSERIALLVDRALGREAAARAAD